MKYILLLLAFTFYSCDFEDPKESLAKEALAKVNAKKPKKETSVIEGNVIKTFYRNGKLKSSKEFIIKKANADTVTWRANHGVVKHYYPNGNLKSELLYDEGTRHGVAKMYYDDGPLRISENYNQGKLDGEKTRYTKEGNPMMISYFKNGVPTKTSKLFEINGKELPKPQLKFSYDDQRLKTSTIIVKVEVKNLKNLYKADFSVVGKNYNGSKFELKVPVKYGVGTFPINVPADMLYVNKLYVNAKYLLKSGDVGSIVDNYNLVLHSLY